jgi:hypothetical protein
MRAWLRETDGSSRDSALAFERPIVSSPTIGTRVPSASTSSSGALAPGAGLPHAPQTVAGATWRRQVAHSTG